ncbi:chymase-like [Elephas maximus indicus]|uniref:chymase-like n=1 Tax=Elephas maximus indicus TaxID=99487 RepID=UPI002116D7D1|nr:chymase-like [Elephas maximus indicus]
MLMLFGDPKLNAGEVIKRGTEARPHSRPYMAFIKYINQRNTWKRCGGFLVREDFAMTAAHCNGREIGVVLGAHNIKNKEETMQEIPVLQAFPHPEFNNVSGFSDIMLLKGDSGAPLVCNNVAQGIVCLGRPRKIPMIYTRISTFVPWIHKIMNAP